MKTNEEVEIVLVEDNNSDIELTLHALKKVNLANGIKVLRDGVMALDYFFCRGPYIDREADRQPKVVLLDLKLPRIDGLEVLKQLKNDPKTKTIPVVALTSSREERDILESYYLGVNSYIVKPVDFEQFIAAMRALGMYWTLTNQIPLH